jgi:hypothetical protein
MTLRQFSSKPETIPVSTSWYLADLGEARGREALFIKQSPQRLRVLREHALIESAISSNRIEGVVVDQARIETLIFDKPKLCDRNTGLSGCESRYDQTGAPRSPKGRQSGVPRPRPRRAMAEKG